jgi:multiple antibiotic resistance protein
MDIFKNVALAFIPIFVAVDAIGVLPIFVSLTEGIPEGGKTRVIVQSMFTAIGLAVGFILVGQAVFRILGITMGDFMIAGGAILFCIAIIDIINPVKKQHVPIQELGAVPLGTPLIVGPAVLTTSLAVVSQYGLTATLIAVTINILLAGLIFTLSPALIKLFGDSGTKALSKIMSLLLAAIAIMLIRKGLVQILAIF